MLYLPETETSLLLSCSAQQMFFGADSPPIHHHHTNRGGVWPMRLGVAFWTLTAITFILAQEIGTMKSLIWHKIV